MKIIDKIFLLFDKTDDSNIEYNIKSIKKNLENIFADI